MERFAFAILLGMIPMAATSAPLAEDLKDYVVAFDMAALDRDAQEHLQQIIDDPQASHGTKVLSVHTVLDRNGALRHVDIHGDELPPAQAQIGLASLK